ncbi:MAG: 23S rRNA (uracil(1939)-C(5))-methyltransferase RlmD [Magnetococcales bacterium]|nr:23S rRNA (uracil(1939)-C(5))-methyltransferase RlmD [Magnetococcales bacterium]
MDEFELTIDKIVAGGFGLGFHNEKAVFVPFSTPGDHLLVTVTKQYKNHSFAAIKKIITPGSGRTPPQCLHYGKCGGCQLQHISAKLQGEVKANFVAESIQRIGKINPDGIVAKLKSSPLHVGYRRRAGLKVRVIKSGVLLGFFAAGTHRVVDLSSCPILDPRLNDIVEPLRGLINSLKDKNFIPEVDCVAGDENIGLVFHTLRAFCKSDLDRLKAFAKEQQLPQLWVQQGKKARLRSIHSNKVLSYELEEFSINFKPGDFIQVNGAANRLLVAEVLKAIGDDLTDKNGVVWDLFCGIGNFTLPLAKKFAKVYGVESQPRALERLSQNVKLANIDNIIPIKADLFKPFGLDKLNELDKADLVLLDPPRSGGIELVKRVVKIQPQKLVYISCDSATFARDAGVLVNGGYTLNSLLPIDLFPQTSHVEMVGVFEVK